MATYQYVPKTPEQKEKLRIRSIRGSAKYRSKNKDKITAYNKKRYSETRNRELARKKQNRRDDRIKFLLSAAKSRAKKKNIAFELTYEDIVIPDTCPILGIPLFFSERGKGRGDNTPSPDRLDPSLGYTKDNVRIISWRANKLKSNGTAEEHRLIAEWMAKESTSPLSQQLNNNNSTSCPSPSSPECDLRQADR
jgi:hypothetical protein